MPGTCIRGSHTIATIRKHKVHAHMGSVPQKGIWYLMGTKAKRKAHLAGELMP